MLLTRKYKIQVSDEHKDVLWNIYEQCRLVFNNALSERKSAWEIWADYQDFLDNLQTELQLAATCKNLHA